MKEENAMKEKRDLKTIFSQSDDSIAQRIADSHKMLSEDEKKAVYSRITERTDLAGENSYADSVHGVEVRRSHGMLRYIGIAAACAMLIGGIGGGTYLMGRSGSSPVFTEVETEAPGDVQDGTDTTEAASDGNTTEADAEVSEEEAAESEPEITEDSAPVTTGDFDMTTKLGVLGKMINSENYYDQVSGSFYRYDTARTDLCTRSDYSADLTTGKAWDRITRFNIMNTPEEAADGNIDGIMDAYFGSFDVYCDGSDQYNIFPATMTYSRSNTEPDMAGHRDRDLILDPEKLLSILADPEALNTDGMPEVFSYMAGKASSNTRAACDTLTPVDTIADHLKNTDLWEITGETEYAGRTCVVLEGTVPADPVYIAPVGGTFVMYVDKETGVLLKYKDREPDGTLAGWLVTEEIHFDSDAVPVQDADLSIYTMMPDYDAAPEELKERKKILTNSSGKTYTLMARAVVREYYDELPDLVPAICFYKAGGYVYKDDYFNAFGDDPESECKTYAVVEKTDSTPAGIDITVRDCEGNELYLLTYYKK